MQKGNWNGGRIQVIDALRGLSVVLMVIHHFGFDLALFELVPAWLLDNGIVFFLHVVFASVFIVLSGVSSRFSRDNVRRGIKTLLCAAAVTLATWAVGLPDWWGILHLLGFCMAAYGLTSGLLDKMPEKAGMVIYFLLFAAAFVLLADRSFDVPYLAVLGFPDADFASSDYFPVLPWVFMFLFGTCLGRMIFDGRLPARFYGPGCPALERVGRRSLLIYMLHQPVLYGLTLLLAKALGG